MAWLAGRGRRDSAAGNEHRMARRAAHTGARVDESDGTGPDAHVDESGLGHAGARVDESGGGYAGARDEHRSSASIKRVPGVRAGVNGGA